MTTMTTILEPDTCFKSLQRVLEQHDQLAIAVSGGVDSMTLAAIACSLNAETAVFHAISPAVPDLATARVRAYAERFNWQLHEINAGEMDDPDYRRNPGNRCYYCKSNLYVSIRKHTNLPIASGTNLDDLQDYRPGLIAAAEQQIIHPLVEARIDKMAVRRLAALIGLQELSELPASPCLSSRVTTGIAIDADLLPLIDQVEEAIRELFRDKNGIKDIRCRIRNNGIAIQLENSAAIHPGQIRAAVQQIFSNTRFTHYSAHISIEPYQQGSAFIRAIP